MQFFEKNVDMNIWIVIKFFFVVSLLYNILRNDFVLLFSFGDNLRLNRTM
jgi:hypothetical protein